VTSPGTPYRPHTLLVARGWLELATPEAVRVGDGLPKADDALRQVGFVRVATAGGSPSVENPMRHPVVAAECWVAPPKEGSQLTPWNAAARLAEWVIAATSTPQLQGRLVDLTGYGAYSPARVHTVVALTEPRRVEGDPSNYARFDLDLHFHWS